jgi:hypothetical protein
VLLAYIATATALRATNKPVENVLTHSAEVYHELELESQPNQHHSDVSVEPQIITGYINSDLAPNVEKSQIPKPFSMKTLTLTPSSPLPSYSISNQPQALPSNVQTYTHQPQAVSLYTQLYNYQQDPDSQSYHSTQSNLQPRPFSIQKTFNSPQYQHKYSQEYNTHPQYHAHSQQYNQHLPHNTQHQQYNSQLQQYNTQQQQYNTQHQQYNTQHQQYNTQPQQYNTQQQHHQSHSLYRAQPQDVYNYLQSYSGQTHSGQSGQHTQERPTGEKSANVLHQNLDIDVHNYQYSYETENGKILFNIFDFVIGVPQGSFWVC